MKAAKRRAIMVIMRRAIGWFCRLLDKREQDDKARGAIPGNHLVKAVAVSGEYQAIVPGNW